MRYPLVDYLFSLPRAQEVRGDWQESPVAESLWPANLPPANLYCGRPARLGMGILPAPVCISPSLLPERRLNLAGAGRSRDSGQDARFTSSARLAAVALLLLRLQLFNGLGDSR
jgi:hypothetical protein